MRKVPQIVGYCDCDGFHQRFQDFLILDLLDFNIFGVPERDFPAVLDFSPPLEAREQEDAISGPQEISCHPPSRAQQYN